MSKQSSTGLSKKLGTSLVSVIILLLVIEAGFRLFYRDPAEDFVDVQHDAILYFSARPGQTHPGLHINSLGLRGPETKEKDPSRFRFLATGDSFTFGPGVTDEESWPLQLGALLEREGARQPGSGRPIEVLNGGFVGWGVFQMERYLRRAIPRFNPGVVVLMVTPIDIYRQPFSDPKEFLRMKDRRAAMRKASRFLTFIVRQVQRLKGVGIEVPRGMALEPLWAADAARIRSLVADFSGETRFILGVTQDYSDVHDWVAAHALALARELGVDAIDVPSVLPAVDPRDVTISPEDLHPNRRGHARIARAVADLVYSRDIAVRRGSDTVEARVSRPAP